MRRAALAGVLLFAVAAADAVLLRFKFFPDPQKAMLYESRFVSSNKMELLDANGRVLKSEPIEGGNHSRWREKTLAVSGGRRTSFVRTYDDYQSLTGVTLRFDRLNGKFVARPLNGASVPAEKLEGEASSEDGDPFATDKAMLPPGPVAVGATWSVDTSPVIRDWELFEIGRPSKGTAKLTAISGCVATIVIDQQFEAIGTGEDRFDAPVPAKLRLQYDACIDGTSAEYHSRMEVTFSNSSERAADGNRIRQSLRFTRSEDQRDVQ